MHWKLTICCLCISLQNTYEGTIGYILVQLAWPVQGIVILTRHLLSEFHVLHGQRLNCYAKSLYSNQLSRHLLTETCM